MRTLDTYIYEGQVDGLKDVKIIRHYTTGPALKSILKSGKLIPSESEGDDDWKDYELQHKKVVSFHDVRTDPEWSTWIKNNNRRISIEGMTSTLALHMKKACVCIEVNYDKLDEQIQNDSHLLNIYKKKAEEFVNGWNHLVSNNDNNEMYNYNITKVKICDLILKAYEDEELMKSLKYCWGEYNFAKKYQDDESKLAADEVYNIFKEVYKGEDINREITTYVSYRKEIFWLYEFGRQIGWGFGWGFPTKEKAKTVKSKYQKSANLYKRRDFKKIPENKVESFAEMVAKFDVVGAIKFLKKYGWRLGDSELDELTGGRGRYQDGSHVDWSIGWWLDELSKNKNRIVNANIEIRIPFEIELTKENSTIKIFTGIAEATKQQGLLKLPQKYMKQYNIEYVEPEDN